MTDEDEEKIAKVGRTSDLRRAYRISDGYAGRANHALARRTFSVRSRSGAGSGLSFANYVLSEPSSRSALISAQSTQENYKGSFSDASRRDIASRLSRVLCEPRLPLNGAWPFEPPPASRPAPLFLG